MVRIVSFHSQSIYAMRVESLKLQINEVHRENIEGAANVLHYQQNIYTKIYTFYMRIQQGYLAKKLRDGCSSSMQQQLATVSETDRKTDNRRKASSNIEAGETRD